MGGDGGARLPQWTQPASSMGSDKQSNVDAHPDVYLHHLQMLCMNFLFWTEATEFLASDKLGSPCALLLKVF